MSPRLIVSAVLGTGMGAFLTLVTGSVLLQPITTSSGRTIHPHPDVQGWIFLGAVLLGVLTVSSIALSAWFLSLINMHDDR